MKFTLLGTSYPTLVSISSDASTAAANGMSSHLGQGSNNDVIVSVLDHYRILLSPWSGYPYPE